ncbi:MAG: hypothetical protein JJE44_13360, partial [Flavobacteriaceae bacterium]|nr:hypothetical protein [Flavobacteriaceae bacterium]
MIQSGNQQLADVQQTGTNTALVTQNQSGTPSNTPAYMNNAVVLQNGAGNNATILQDELGGGGKGGNDAEITQLGSGNTSSQTTYAPGSNAGQDVEAYQNGTNNNVTQNIQGGYTDYFYTKQLGTSNTATQTGTGVTYNTAKIFQDGT